MTNKFYKDLEFGQYYERKLITLLNFDSYIIKTGYFPEYDVKITYNNITTKYEVKSDRWAYKTNSIAIEYEYNKNPSGIAVTKADYYAYFVTRPYDIFELYIIPVEIIKENINNNKYKRIVCGGDKQTKMYIFDIEEVFKQYKYTDKDSHIVDVKHNDIIDKVTNLIEETRNIINAPL
jgi:hypothetical protein